MSLTQINKAGLDELALDHVFTIGASGTDHYTFQGEGLNGTVNDPTLYLTRGKTYRFENGTGAHPIRIQSTQGASGTAYNTGVTNNAGSGTVIVEVQHDAPDVLYYQCTSHANMNGVLYITGALADGGVTTAKLADNAVNGSKIATNAVGQAALADNAVDTAAIANNAVTQQKIAADAVQGTIIANNAITTAKIADDAVTQAKIAANAVDTTELAVGAVTHDQLANNTVDADHLQSNAVTTAKIADDAVTAAKLANDAVISSNIVNGAVDADKIANDAVTNAKMANNAVDDAVIATAAVTTPKIADNAVTTAKLASGAADLSNDTSPQLGGDLDTNSNHIVLNDTAQLNMGASTDFVIRHNAASGIAGGNTLGGGATTKFFNPLFEIYKTDGTKKAVVFNPDGSQELYYNTVKQLETTENGIKLPKGCIRGIGGSKVILGGTLSPNTDVSWNFSFGSNDFGYNNGYVFNVKFYMNHWNTGNYYKYIESIVGGRGNVTGQDRLDLINNLGTGSGSWSSGHLDYSTSLSGGTRDGSNVNLFTVKYDADNTPNYIGGYYLEVSYAGQIGTITIT